MQQQAKSSTVPLSERLAKWNRTWARIAARVFSEDENSLVQEAQEEARTEVNDYANRKLD